jgi:programmed cell death protein 5
VPDLPAEQNEEHDERLRKAISKRMQELQLEDQKKEIARKYLSTEAYERLMNVRMSNHELYDRFINMLVAMIQSNRMGSPMSEIQLRAILERLTTKPESKIEFKRK